MTEKKKKARIKPKELKINEVKGRWRELNKYKIGQILTSKEEVVLEKGISGEKVVIPKGNRIMIGADKLAHHLKNGCIQPLPEDAEVKGYDTESIASVIYDWLNRRFNLQEDMLDDYEIEKQEFIDEIEYALSEYVGM